MRSSGLFISHGGNRCGVWQYGRNLFDLLASRSDIDWSYRECDSEDALLSQIDCCEPDVVLFNYQGSTLPWVTGFLMRNIGAISIGVFHESNQHLIDVYRGELFDFWLCPNPSIIPRNPRVLRVPRFLPAQRTGAFAPDVFTVGSFGFATPTKGFERLCRLVNQQLDEAIIRINMPPHDKPEIFPSPTMIEDIAALCRDE